MTTPGARAASEEAARFGSGRPASISRLTVCAMLELCDSTSGIEAATSTASVRPAMVSVKSTASVWLTAGSGTA